MPKYPLDITNLILVFFVGKPGEKQHTKILNLSKTTSNFAWTNSLNCDWTGMALGQKNPVIPLTFLEKIGLPT